ncbi:glycoside hydrolase family 35 protein [Haematomicrobium sanguinis]|uniref:glycoside hydrolase family 35 protein n=1 Tax=Haematomicrobium sanguinis TaxID=479106 RepID=UPI000478E2F5|nr:glycoside hydrolase family 35 protein [Haematomicrobium sanguinis]
MDKTFLSYADGKFYRDGKEHRILAGAVHYFRIHPDLWEDRLRRLKAIGANTVDTYVPWNFHQMHEDQAPDFSGWRDIAAYVRLAGDLGLDVIVRPGPYICAEWDNGGFPSWFTAKPGMRLRCHNEQFEAGIESWFDQLLPQLTPLNAANGGPIVAYQIENEYGSYGDDLAYLEWNKKALEDRGVSELLFTADGGSDYFLDGGEMPGVLAAATYGSGSKDVLEVWGRRRPGEPLLNIEFWCGWFDHWGEHHHVRSAESAAQDIATTLDGGGSVCLYMAHGGTNFGLFAGANFDVSGQSTTRIQPDVTSYDYDAPIAEDGTLTDKFHAIRAEYVRYNPEAADVPADLLEPIARVGATDIPMTQGTGLLEFLRSMPRTDSVAPLSFEALGLDQGMVLYRTRAILSKGEYALRIIDLHDRADIYINGELLGTVDENSAVPGLVVKGDGTEATIEILVENRGRINYGYRIGEGKGILGHVLFGGRSLFNWEQYAIPVAEFGEEILGGQGNAADSGDEAGTAGFATGTLALEQPKDAWIATAEFGRGFLWVNGFLAGRYSAEGPQKTLYVPAPLLRAGDNTVTVLELEARGDKLTVEDGPDYGPTTPPAK